MATPAQVAASVLAAVPTLATLQRTRLRNQWATAWDAYAAQVGAPSRFKAGWWVHHEVVRALRIAHPDGSWAAQAEQARARWETNAERYPLMEIWGCSNRFVARDTIRAVLVRDAGLDPTVYALLTAPWRAVFPGFDS